MVYARINSTDSRLGRHIHHDPASWNFKAAEATAVIDVMHPTHIKVLDQGQLGSCTGNALAGALGHDPLYKGEVDNEKLAIKLYKLATRLDGAPGLYPPDDTGSDGLSVCKAGVQLGYLTKYAHTFSFKSMLKALVLQPVIIGTNWYEGMFHPAADGEVSISGKVAGGHEYCAFGIDTANQRVWFVNSWGSQWGKNGTFYMSYATVERLLKERGDVTVPLV